MEGKFIKKKGGIQYFFLLAVIVCGLALVKYIKTDSKTDPFPLPLLLLVPLVIGGICVAYIQLHNHGAYFRIENGRIKTKFNWLAKLDRPVEDVVFVDPSFPVQGLTLLFKDGKRANVIGMENYLEVSEYLQKQIFSLEKEIPKNLREEIAAERKKRKKHLGVIIAGICAMFALIFVTMLLTGERDLGDFSKNDRIIFSCFIAAELLMLIAVLVLADKCGKAKFTIDYLTYRLRGAMILSSPLPEGSVQGVYTDTNNDCRVIVCGNQEDKSIYYTGQFLEDEEEMELLTLAVSKDYADIEEEFEIPFNELIDITEFFSINNVG